MGISNHSGITIAQDGVPAGGTTGQVLTKLTSQDYDTYWANGGGGGGSVNSVTGLNTNNTDPANPVVQISVDGVTITGAGTPGSPLTAATGGGGDVVGPASATDNAIARFDGTTGKLIQNSAATIADTSGNIVAGTYNGNTIGAGSTSGTNTGDQTSVSGNAGTVTFVDAGGDTTCFVALGTSATGNLSPATDAGLTYNATTNVLTATGFVGTLTGNADTATALQNARTIGGVSFDGTANIVPQTIQSINEATDTTCFPLFISASGSQSLQPLNNVGFAYNSNTNNLTVTTFTGALTGNATTATALATGRTIAITGDLAYTSPSFDGSGNVTAAGTLATVNGNVGSFGSATQAGTFTVNGKGLLTAAGNTTVTPAVGSITGLGTGVATFLATPSSANLISAVTDETGTGKLVFATSPSFTTPALGTPSSGTLSNCTGYAVGNLSGVGAGIATFLTTPSSANLAATVTDETGSGALVFATSPTLVTPLLGTPTSGTLTSCTGLPVSTGLTGNFLATLWIPANAMRPSSTGGCAALGLVATGANLPDISSLNFDPSTIEYSQFAVRFPKSWNNGTVTATFYWSHAATVTNFGVVWTLQGYAASSNDAIGTAYGTAQSVTSTGGTTDNLYISSATAAITISGTPATADEVFFRISRDATNGSDTLAVDARLMGVALFYTRTAVDDA